MGRFVVSCIRLFFLPTRRSLKTENRACQNVVPLERSPLPPPSLKPMQRHLHQSLRLLCRQKCCRRPYSAQAVATQEARPPPKVRPTTNSSEQPGPSKNSEASIGLASTAAELKSKKRRRGELLLQGTGISSEGAEAMLASLRVEGVEPTIDDLHALTPTEIPSGTTKDYTNSYTEFRDKLCRSFSKAQLERFTQELKLKGNVKSRARKVDFADTIMVQYWGWESLKEVERRRRDKTEVTKKCPSFLLTCSPTCADSRQALPMSASELFLLLGKGSISSCLRTEKYLSLLAS